MSSLPFEIQSGVVDVGWGDFSVRVGDHAWSCQASYVAAHPLDPLIHSAVDLYDHILEDPLPIENAIWDSLAADEPGGNVIRAVPQAEYVRVKVFRYREQLWPDPAKLTTIPPVADVVMDYWAYAEAIFNDASSAIARQGFAGFRNGWEPGSWNAETHHCTLPIERFFYLASLIKNRTPRKRLSFQEELSLLTNIDRINRGIWSIMPQVWTPGRRCVISVELTCTLPDRNRRHQYVRAPHWRRAASSVVDATASGTSASFSTTSAASPR